MSQLPAPIFVSTGGFRNSSIAQISKQLLECNLHCIEFSSGIYEEDIVSKLVELQASGITVQIHNYFPVPKKSFVINLASTNDFILQQSRDHARRSIDIAARLHTRRYSIHSGFCIDPNANSLGSSFGKATIDYSSSQSIFIDSITELLGYANSKNVDLYIENNNLIKENMSRHNSCPLLGVSLEEMALYKEKTGVKILIDTGHLLVSSNTLNLNILHQLEMAYDVSDAYHISTNDSLRDSNLPINDDDIFLPSLNPHSDFFTLEIYDKPSIIKHSFDTLSTALQKLI